MQIFKKFIPHRNSRIPADELIAQLNEKYNLEITKEQFDDVVDKYINGEYGFHPALNAFLRNLLLDKDFFNICDEDYKNTIREIFTNQLTLSSLNTMVNNTIYEKYYKDISTVEA